MRLLVASLGSRGDVETFTLLAEALAARGHDVVLAVDDAHRATVHPTERLVVVSLGGLTRDELAGMVAEALRAPTPEARGRLAHESFVWRRRRELAARLEDLVAGGGFDRLVLSRSLLFDAGDRRAVLVFNTLMRDRDYHACADAGALRLSATSALFAPADARVRAAWTFVGFCLRPAGAPDAALARWLDAGAPPFFLTMGSMTGFDGAAPVGAFVRAARALGARAILQRAWAGLAHEDDLDVRTVDEIDYATVFPRCAAVFTHGGAGTVAHALLAGRPLAILPRVDDQLAWTFALASFASYLGSADPFVPSIESFDRLMRRAADTRVGDAAARLAERLRHEPGLAGACAAIERVG